MRTIYVAVIELLVLYAASAWSKTDDYKIVRLALERFRYKVIQSV